MLMAVQIVALRGLKKKQMFKVDMINNINYQNPLEFTKKCDQILISQTFPIVKITVKEQ